MSSIEMMTFFLEISAISGSITQFPEIVAQRDDDPPPRKGQHHSRYCLQCNTTSMGIDLSDWCAAKFVKLISCDGRRKSLGTTDLRISTNSSIDASLLCKFNSYYNNV